MKKKLIVAVALIMVLGMIGCNSKSKTNQEKIEGTDDPTSVTIESKDSENETVDIPDAVITDEQALTAIKNYCYINNPDLEAIEKAGEYPVYWNITSSDEKQIVVLFRSYTGAEVRYYIDKNSGDTYVTEFVPGILTEEERTDESFNVKDYFTR